MFNKNELLFIANKLNASIAASCDDANDVGNFHHILTKIGELIQKEEENGEDVPTDS